MKIGDVVANRFELEYERGAGGMGTVYRARDRHTGNTVALKVLHGRGAMESERFVRESAVLAELSHPGIVRFVTMGEFAGERYLVMEWLEGEDLDARLGREGLTLDEAVAVVRSAAEALAVAHARNVIHRDIKPANLFLVGNSPEHVKVLDFGIARRRNEARGLTRTGVLLGTPEYMAPEQARGSHAIDARVDVFALGCVLFECITGQPAFAGENLMAVLAKILLEDAPRLSQVRTDAPPALDELLASMLAKDPARRPANGAEVAAALAGLGPLSGEASAPRASLPPALTTHEQRVVCVVLARAPDHHTDVLAATMVVEPTAPAESLASTVAAQGARLEVLADGSSIAIVAGHGTARDEAARAARVALAMRAALPDLPIVLLTGRGVVSDRLPVGEVIDRASREILLAKAGGPIRLDDVTAGLIDTRFDVVGDAAGLELRGERPDDTPRTVLGRTTNCVGRDREIAALQGLFEECVGEPVSRVALLTAPAGAGKSRVFQELLVRNKHREPRPVTFVGRADPMSSGSPLALIASAIRNAASIRDAEDIATRRRKLHALVARSLQGEQLKSALAFLGELADVPFDDEHFEALRAARKDPVLMNDSMRSAFVDWLAAECEHQPVAFVLEDLHWGDRPTVDFIDTALRLLHDAPFFVLATARPEVHETFPRLWAEREVQEFRLASLTRKACERLVRDVLGDSVDADVVARIIERSEGNAFFLEELMRFVAAGTRLDTLPDSVLGTVQSRIDALSAESRRVLRAASVFGQTFWRGGVLALLGTDRRTTTIVEHLDELEAREIIARSVAAPRVADVEYVFRHALVRDAAYAMLTPNDLALGHRLAGEWLEQTGVRDPVLLAEHFDRGADGANAARWYAAAAEQSLEANDLARVIELATRGLVHVRTGPIAVRLLSARSEAAYFRGEHDACIADAVEVLPMVAAGSTEWFHAQGGRMLALAQNGRFAEIEVEIEGVFAAQPIEDSAYGAKIECLSRIGSGLAQSGRVEYFRRVLDCVNELASSGVPLEIGGRMSLKQIHTFAAGQSGDPISMMRELNDAIATFDKVGNRRVASALRNNAGYVMARFGEIETAERQLRAAIDDANTTGAALTGALAEHNLSFVLRLQGRLDEAITTGQHALEIFARQRNQRLMGATRIYLSEAFFERRDHARAETEATRALEEVAGSVSLEVDAHVARSRARLALGRAEEALADALHARDVHDSVAGIRRFQPRPNLAAADAYLALARRDEAMACAHAAAQRMVDTLGRLEPAQAARSRELAEEWRDVDRLHDRLGLARPTIFPA